jgi:hypothetical protein
MGSRLWVDCRESGGGVDVNGVSNYPKLLPVLAQHADQLLSGRQLVGALRDADLGDWSAEAVRQWIRETPACPVAQPARQQGQGHRYRLLDVVNWLLARAGKDRLKGWTALEGEPDAAPPKGGGEGVGEPVNQANAIDRELSAIYEDLRANPKRDPKYLSQLEDALDRRARRLERIGVLIPAAEIEPVWSAATQAARSEIDAWMGDAPARAGRMVVELLPQAFADPDQRQALDDAFDRVCSQLARAVLDRLSRVALPAVDHAAD